MNDIKINIQYPNHHNEKNKNPSQGSEKKIAAWCERAYNSV